MNEAALVKQWQPLSFYLIFFYSIEFRFSIQ